MRRIFQFFVVSLSVITITISLSSFHNYTDRNRQVYQFPYKEAGLTDRQAAAHLLSRFTFGATPQEVDEVVKKGLENWFERQLSADQPNDSLNQMLSSYEALSMNNQQIVNRYQDLGQVAKTAIEEGFITKEAVDSLKRSGKTDYKEQLQTYMDSKGIKPKRELLRQLIAQKILRAAYSQNQLQEVLTSFWFNHFNVSLTKNESSRFVLAYERDVIRPNVLGKFEQLLLATATSPAMLTYLDNTKSVVAASNDSVKQGKRMAAFMQAQDQTDTVMQSAQRKVKKLKKSQGLNENYAREIMELHTLGVDGGYTQNDVTEAAKILTGWMVYPMQGFGKQAVEKITGRLGEEKMANLGYVHNGDFLFAAKRHDFTAKHFLNTEFPAGNGYNEGIKLLHLLSHHPSTARFICTKLAARFVNDEPPASLVKKMADTFIKQDGEIRAVLIAMVTAPEFWSKSALREKIKSPFELAISSVRATNASIKFPYPLYTWISKMGEQMYAYQAPTGFPDKAKYWINTGALLYRMNFGLAFATGRISGVSYDVASIANGREPESAEAALAIYGSILMPERDLEETQKRLLPLLKDPGIEKKIAAAANKMSVQVADTLIGEDAGTFSTGQKTKDANRDNSMQPQTITSTALMQVIGILIGSPEFQRR